MQTLTFRRWFPSGARKDHPDVSFTFPVDTNAQKIVLAEFVLREPGTMCDFVESRMERTTVLVEAADGEALHVKDALQFFVEGYDDDGNPDETLESALCFLLSTPAEKVAFADWLVEHKLGGSQGLKLYLGEATVDSALIEDYAQPLSNLRVPCGSKNDHIIQVITYSYTPLASILNIPRDVRPPPMMQFELP